MKIDLSSSEISSENLRTMLTAALTKLSKEEQSNLELDLSDNQLDIYSLIEIANLLSSEPRITALNLAYNKIRITTPEDLNIFNNFCATIAQSKIKSLNMAGLRFLGDSGFECLVRSLLTYKNKTLYELKLSNTGLTDRSVPQLEQLVITNRTLCKIDLSKNQLSYAGLNPLFALFNKWFFLRKLDLRHNPFCKASELQTKPYPLEKIHAGPAIFTDDNEILELGAPSLLATCAKFFVENKCVPQFNKPHDHNLLEIEEQIRTLVSS